MGSTSLRRVLTFTAVLVAGAAAGAGLVWGFAGGDESLAPTEARPTKALAKAGRAERRRERAERRRERGGGAARRRDVDGEDVLKGAKAGDVVMLDARRYGVIEIKGRKFDEPVQVVGQRGTVVGGIVVSGSRNVELAGFDVTGDGTTAPPLDIGSSRQITLRSLRFSAPDPVQGVRLRIDRDATDVRVLKSDFTACMRQKACIQPGGERIEIRGNRFHDLRSTDSIKGGGSDVRLIGNDFRNAFPSEEGKGPHVDFVQIMGGGPWLISRNRFGQRRFGAAQLFVSPSISNTENPIHDVRVELNVFVGDMAYAVRVAAGEKSDVGPPRRVVIVNNTILSGHTSAVLVSDGFGTLPAADRPLLANNVLGAFSTKSCHAARTASNVILKGSVCGTKTKRVAARFDGEGRPVSGKQALRNVADTRYAPKLDKAGKKRIGRPDIGAYEVPS